MGLSFLSFTEDNIWACKSRELDDKRTLKKSINMVLHVSPLRKSPGDSGMGSPSSRGEHTPAFEDQRPVDEGAELGVANCLLAACSA
jgi:hypothetical protein